MIWNLSTSTRNTHELERQAAFIDSFKPRDVWQRVLIIVKEAKNPRDQAKGTQVQERSKTLTFYYKLAGCFISF